ncbi:MAG: TlpA disulfide reductase family protein [Ethanoligenens sp.]
MKKKWSLALGVLLLTGVLVGAASAYHLLAGKTSPVTPSAGSSASTTSGTSVGQKAPDITVTDRDGKTLMLSSLRGKPVVLNFWASWCPPCQEEMPDYQSLYKGYGNQVSFVMVDMVGARGETVSAGKAFLSQNKYTFPAYFDTEGAAADVYGVTSIPRSYYIDKNGVIRAKFEGVMNNKQMESAMQTIL